MFDKNILRLVPERVYCPLCGQWHDFEGEALQSYSEDEPYEYECDVGNSGKDVTLKFWTDDDCIHIKSSDLCDKVNTYIDDEVYLDDIECRPKLSEIRFSIPITTDEIVGVCECEDCENNYSCNLWRIGGKRDDYANKFKLDLEFTFMFSDEDFERLEETRREQELAKQREEEAKREQELAKQREEEAKCEQELEKTQETEKTTKEDTTMANNLFNMNMEFGPNKDENIASTIMGVAVKSGDSWRIYDKKKKEITDVGDMQLGNLPIFILPTTKLTEGDLIKDAGEYYFVIKVQRGNTQTLCAKTGEMKTVIPIKNVLGLSCYSKVIALSDSLDIGEDFDVEKLAIISAMCGQSGENSSQMNQMLPFMLFKDKLSGDDDMMKLSLMSSMMTSGEDGSQMNQLLPLMFLKNGDNGNDDMMKLALMSSMMTSGEDGSQMNQLLPLMFLKNGDNGNDDMMQLVLMSSMMGGNTGSNNPLMSYLMLDTFMGKKEDKAPKNKATKEQPKSE